MLNTRYRLTSSDIACEEFDGEIVVLNLALGHHFELNKTGSSLLNAVLQGHAIKDLLSIECTAYSSEEAADFFNGLLAQQLIAPDASGPPMPVGTEVEERLKKSTEKPILVLHDDLADLIIADPIHDTDESAGWPATKVG